MNEVPPCFEPHEFEEWLEHARVSNFRSREKRFCQDCTPQFKEEQLEAGLCSRPDTQFVKLLPAEEDPDDEPELVGISLQSLAVMRRLNRVIE